MDFSEEKSPKLIVPLAVLAGAGIIATLYTAFSYHIYQILFVLIFGICSVVPSLFCNESDDFGEGYVNFFRFFLIL
eukprot:TRINITY_DN3279_c2_g1_i2.p1 TRINITY_DN3279_c2_g1~~TRINITY_DN3279_c2_g1_i2.p1  ORF type:complete len:86 (+),score=8.51 TRINITY_DN3279_c2_g1_i2:31-258(+)